MSGNSTYFGNKILGIIQGTPYTAPATVYIGLFNGDPTDAGTGGTEVTTTIRPAGRVAVSWGAVANKSMANAAVVSFGAANAAATITHFAIFDAASGGNMLGSNPLGGGTGPQPIGTTISFPVGSLTWGE